MRRAVFPSGLVPSSLCQVLPPLINSDLEGYISMSAAARCSSSGKDRKKAYIKAQKGDNLQEIVLVFSVDLHFARSKICYE